jgi:hypothetical protein
VSDLVLNLYFTLDIKLPQYKNFKANQKKTGQEFLMSPAAEQGFHP